MENPIGANRAPWGGEVNLEGTIEGRDPGFRSERVRDDNCSVGAPMMTVAKCVRLVSVCRMKGPSLDGPLSDQLSRDNR